MRLKPLLALFLAFAAAPAFAHEMPDVCPGTKKGTYLGDFTLDASKVSRFQDCIRRGVRAVRPPRAVLKTTGAGGGSGSAADPLPHCALSASQTVVMTACPRGICGDFDDDYRLAQETGISICTTEALEQQAATLLAPGGSVLAVFEYPAEFIGQDHHADYQRSMGGGGICVFCPAPTEEPSYD